MLGPILAGTGRAKVKVNTRMLRQTDKWTVQPADGQADRKTYNQTRRRIDRRMYTYVEAVSIFSIFNKVTETIQHTG